jgi:hypothetical protein
MKMNKDGRRASGIQENINLKRGTISTLRESHGN